ncbi:MAG: hypothetical protein Q9228_001921 [Teloschistes exilis]
MASVAFPSISKITRLPNGTTYSYVFVEPKGNKPYILFLHGFPSSSFDWRHQIPFFSNAGYGVIVPDLLGYGGTDKPEVLEAYRLKSMSDDMASLLDHLQVKEVFGVGHDWYGINKANTNPVLAYSLYVRGSFLLSRLANYHPDRFIAYVFLDIGYWAPYADFDVDAINAQAERQFGYSIFGYWHFFNAPDSAQIMVDNFERSMGLCYPADPEALLQHLCPLGAARKYYEMQSSEAVAPWFSPAEQATYRQIFSAKNGGFAGGLNWYKAQMGRVNAADERALPSERYHIDKPTLMVVCTKDPVAIPAIQTEGMKPYVKQLEVESLDCGHWVQLVKVNEVNEILKGFFDRHRGDGVTVKL